MVFIIIIIFIILWVAGFYIYINRERLIKFNIKAKTKEDAVFNSNKFATLFTEYQDFTVKITYKDGLIDTAQFCDLIVKEATKEKENGPQGKNNLNTKETKISDIKIHKYLKQDKIETNETTNN